MKLAVRSTGAHNLLVVAAIVFATTALPAQVVFHVSLGQASATWASGRLLVFAKPLGPADKRPVAAVDMDQIDARATAIAAQEVAHLEPGATIAIDADVTAFPTPFSQLKPGRYAVQAVLDRDHSYNYTGRGPGDLVSGVVEVDLPRNVVQLVTLANAIPETDPLQPLSNVPAALKEVYAAAKADIHPIDFTSQALSRFWGRPAAFRGWVVTPPDYAAHLGQQGPGDDLGGDRPVEPHRHERVRRQRQQWVVGPCADSRADPRPGTPIPHGRQALGPPADRTLLRRLGGVMAASDLSQTVRRRLAHLARPQRFPRLLGYRPLRPQCQRLSQAGWDALAAGARQG